MSREDERMSLDTAGMPARSRLRASSSSAMEWLGGLLARAGSFRAHYDTGWQFVLSPRGYVW